MEKNILRVTCGRYHTDLADGGRIFDCDEGFLALTGYRQEQFDKKEVTFYSLIPPDEYDEYMEKIQKVVEDGGGALDHRILCADGSKLDIICIGRLYTAQDGRDLWEITISDISSKAANERKIVRSEREIKALIDNMPGGILVCKVVDGKIRTVKASDEYYRILGLDKGGMEKACELLSDKDYDKLMKNINECVENQFSFEQDMRVVKKDGEVKYVLLRARYYDSDTDGAPMLYCAVMDITESKQSERMLQKQSKRFEMISENVDEIFFDYDSDTDEIFISAKESKYDGKDNIVKDFMKGKKANEFIHPDDREMYYNLWQTVLSTPSKGSLDFRTSVYDNDYRWYRITYISAENENGEIVNIYGILYCIDHMKSLRSTITNDRKEIERLSNTDPVTGLYNKNAFTNFAAQKLKEIYNDGECFAIGYSDINDFSYVNENFGYEAGNRMLRDFAEIIRGCGINVIGCRIYSDYFVSLYRAKDRETMIREIGRRNETFTDKQKKKYPMSDIQISCGLYFLKSADEDMNIAIDNANLARRSIKGSSDIPSGVYAERMRAKRSHDQTIASEIGNAIKTGAIELFLQPKFDLETREIIGAEALTRWRNPDGTYKMPYEFIDVLENVGYITQLDLYIYEQSLKCLARWKEEGKKLVPVSINFSRKHNNNPDFVDNISRLAEKYGVDKSLIEIEVTESCFTQDVKNLFLNMRRLREQGFKVDIDDFGMGYSSLSVLMDAPVDIVKVDKVFIDNIEANERSREYINRICSLIKTTQKDIIFEGVETEQQAKILCDSGHRMAQGWLFDKAISVAEFDRKYL